MSAGVPRAHVTATPSEEDGDATDGGSGRTAADRRLAADGGEPAPLSVETVLVPVDGSDESATAVEYAVAVAERYDAGVHVVYVLGEEVVRGMATGAVEPGHVADGSRSFLAETEAVADEAGVPVATSTTAGFSTERLSQHPGSVVLDTAEDVGADFLVVPRESATGERAEVLEKTAEYVLLYASQPVLSV